MKEGKIDANFEKMALGYGPTTAKIIYRIPDYRRLLQEFIWQDYDLFPDFPRLQRLLEHWKTLDGPVHSVEVAHSRLIKPAELKKVDGIFRLN